ncbi:hypothetical protein V6N11_082844 [Hibiscus sabdariffa]|uniref:Uncharacterized protein n=1 Tax=Hibiscus sabdariffa TaxID=183260 RepID=A0ABR2QK37_9ROSI
MGNPSRTLSYESLKVAINPSGRPPDLESGYPALPSSKGIDQPNIGVGPCESLSACRKDEDVIMEGFGGASIKPARVDGRGGVSSVGTDGKDRAGASIVTDQSGFVICNQDGLAATQGGTIDTLRQNEVSFRDMVMGDMVDEHWDGTIDEIEVEITNDDVTIEKEGLLLAIKFSQHVHESIYEKLFDNPCMQAPSRKHRVSQQHKPSLAVVKSVSAKEDGYGSWYMALSADDASIAPMTGPSVTQLKELVINA